MKILLQTFDNLYKQKAPKRYEQLQDGINLRKDKEIYEKLHVKSIPDEYFDLYAWKNGFKNLPDGWKSEFEEDAWYEQIPLDDQAHFNSIKTTIELIEMWEGIQKDQKDDCYRKRGFIPFLSYQSWGLSVIDTVGYFGGEKGQIIGFDYKSANGYNVEFENLKSWLETQIQLLEEDLYFVRESCKEQERHAKILFEKDPKNLQTFFEFFEKDGPGMIELQDHLDSAVLK